MASAVLMIYLGYGYNRLIKAISPEFLRVGEALGAILYVVLGLAGIFVGANFCRNFIFDNGSVGDMISAGNISFMSYTVGFKVMTGIGFLLILMLGIIKPDGLHEELDWEKNAVSDINAGAAEAVSKVNAGAEKAGVSGINSGAGEEEAK